MLVSFHILEAVPALSLIAVANDSVDLTVPEMIAKFRLMYPLGKSSDS